LPLGVPAADVLAGDAQLVGDLGSGVAGGKQGTGLHADAFERLAVTQTAGVAAVGGWSHAAMLPGQPPIMSSEWASLFLGFDDDGLAVADHDPLAGEGLSWAARLRACGAC
jgi:hypothetical protein